MSRHSDLNDLIDVRRLVWDPTEQPVTHTRTIDFITEYEQHHTGGVGPKSLSFEHKAKWCLQIEAYHEWTKRWSDIFYNIFVFADGEIWEGRDILRTSQGNISRAVTVHIPGDNTITTPKQHLSLLKLARWATRDEDRVTRNPALVRDHQQRPAATTCSGSNGRITIQRLRKELNYIMPVSAGPQDLSNHVDFLEAESKGFLSGGGADVASRSVVGVVANRVDEASRDRDAVLHAKIDRQGVRIAEQADQISSLVFALGVQTDRINQLVIREATPTAVNLDLVVSNVISELRDRLTD
jgi:hypothetical protein